MSRIGIITDSHSSITQDEADRLGIKILPMPFYIGGECYYEGKNITRNELMEKLINQEDISTSQPSPEDVMNLWDDVLEEYDNILYMPLSSGLSGSIGKYWSIKVSTEIFFPAYCSAITVATLSQPVG